MTGCPGNDLVLGGPNPSNPGGAGEFINSGTGNDVVYGGPGGDRGSDNGGNDILYTAGDGTGDAVFCGPGQDLTVVDAKDFVADTCEEVSVR